MHAAVVRRTLTAVVLVALAACSDSPLGPGGGPDLAEVRVAANVTGTPIATLVVTVTAADLSAPLVFNLEAVDGVADGTLRVPAGSERRFDVKAYDSDGVVTHEGARTIDIQRGPNPPLSIPLTPRSGQVPVTLTMGDYSVVVSPAAVELEPGLTHQLTATVTAPDGAVLDVQVAWATSDPSRARVDGNGLVTALAEGGATIYATYDGIAGSAAVTVVPVFRLSVVSAGTYHTCGITTDEAAYCWGGNGIGQLGTGTTGADEWVAVPVVGGHGLGSVDNGNDFSCGVTTSGAAYCWGRGANGQLGNGATASSATPVQVALGAPFASVSAGSSHACGVTTAGAAYCWGYGDYGQLGDGSVTSSSTPVPVAGGHVFASISAGWIHTCAVTTNGAAYCWGQGSIGRLGDGRSTNSYTPVAVAGGHVFASVSVSGWHSCGVTTGGAAYCWGGGADGALGDGTLTDRSTPTAVVGGHVFASVSAGDDHTCGATTSGAAYCWGGGASGQLGTGTTTSSAQPAAVAGGHLFASVSAAYQHSCGVTTVGRGYCWGYNFNGRLGDGTNTASATPVRLADPVTF